MGCTLEVALPSVKTHASDGVAFEIKFANGMKGVKAQMRC